MGSGVGVEQGSFAAGAFESIEPLDEPEARGAGAFESIEALDGQLARVARSAGALRLGMGEGLERLARMGGHHELGFASVEGYALERCERSTRWVQASRALARRLAELPVIRGALAGGRISFCMAQVIAPVASAADENIWLAEAESRTVRQMRALVRGRAEASASEGVVAVGSEEERGTLTVTVDCEEGWLFECARTIVRHVGGATLEDALEALVGEGTTALLAELPRDRTPEIGESPRDGAQRSWEAQLAAWRDEAEARCEARLGHGASRNSGTEHRAICDRRAGQDAPDAANAPVAPDAANASVHPVVLDAGLRRLAAELARRDLAIGRLAEAFWKADGWRRLGYATETQYARERLGCSISSIKAKRALARRVGLLTRLSAAIEKGELGYEAARLVSVVAVPETEAGWVVRASERTVRHLREEVDAVQMLGRLSGTSTMLPPTEELMKRVAVVESRIVSGEAFRDGSPGQMFADLSALADHDDVAARPDRRAARQGRVTVRLRAGVGLIRYYRSLEEAFRRHRPGGTSFFGFLCRSLVGSWQPALGTTLAYASVHERDRFRCTSPVCARRDVTPHHLRFRAHGGDDSDENVTSVCSWCHLEGVHGGRLKARPPASNVEWTIGRAGHTVVRGRARICAKVASPSSSAR